MASLLTLRHSLLRMSPTLVWHFFNVVVTNSSQISEVWRKRSIFFGKRPEPSTYKKVLWFWFCPWNSTRAYCLVTGDLSLLSVGFQCSQRPKNLSCWVSFAAKGWKWRWWLSKHGNSNSQKQDKLSIITGSAQGLGKAFAIRLLSAGAKVPHLTLYQLKS